MLCFCLSCTTHALWFKGSTTSYRLKVRTRKWKISSLWLFLKILFLVAFWLQSLLKMLTNLCRFQIRLKKFQKGRLKFICNKVRYRLDTVVFHLTVRYCVQKFMALYLITLFGITFGANGFDPSRSFILCPNGKSAGRTFWVLSPSTLFQTSRKQNAHERPQENKLFNGSWNSVLYPSLGPAS
jgi:hypothetical protein